MCGIAGVIKIHDPKDGPPPTPLQAIPEEWLDILDESIKHRGPDGQGRFRDRAVREDGTVVDVALVHRRLSIIDHEGGHQPMVHDGERLRPDLTYQPGETPIIASEVEPEKPLVAVVFNGCIYNHRELRVELEGQGYKFETDHSDTEVLVHGWRQDQVRVRHQLDGMYGVAIWERYAATLTTMRDDFGQKPLYRSAHWHNLNALSSSTAGLLALAASIQETGENNPGQTRGWIKYGWNQAAKVLGVAESMLPGVSTAIPSNEQDDEGWAHVHNLLLNPEQKDLNAETLDNLLRAAVRSELEADVPIGCFLSGGIDSALICHYAKEAHADITAYTVRMPIASFDESDAASETAKHLGIHHRVLDCDLNPSDDLIQLIEQLGLPFGDSSLLPTHWVCRSARREVKVALAGDGGDELFLGYDRHRVLSLINKLGIPSLASLAAKALPVGRNPKSRVTRASRLLNAAAGEGYKELVAIFPSPFDEQLGISIKPMDHWGLTRGLTPGDGISLRFDRMFYLPEDLLRKSDTASMAVGLEVRAPFLAKELVEAALRTPIEILMPKGERKGLLKQVARKYLPDHIVDRPKQGFAIPIGEWFRNDYGGMRQLLHDHLRSSDPFPGLAESGVELNMKFVERMLKEHDAAGEKSINPWHGRDHSQRLYMMLVLSIWAKWLERVRTGQEKTHA